MYSNLVPFETILETVKDDTGITNLRNLYPKIRRLVLRVERDLGYGGTSLLKRVTYYPVDNKIKLPADMVQLEAVGMCQEGVCPGDYRIQGNYMFFCGDKKIEKFSLIYYALLVDGEGNPVTTENHMEAISAGISYYLYRPRRFNDKGSRATYRDLEDYYHDRIGEARGNDFMPNTMEEWSKAASLLQMSSADVLAYSETERCFCSVPVGDIPEEDTAYNGGGGGGTPDPDNNATMIYSFQFNNLLDDINENPTITDAWLEANGTLHTEAELLTGKFVNYSQTGRIGFVIKSTPDKYTFTDVLGNVLNATVFDKIYDADKGMDIYVSKEYYTESSVYYKFKTN
jgi:hypothetical protein